MLSATQSRQDDNDPPRNSCNFAQTHTCTASCSRRCSAAPRSHQQLPCNLPLQPSFLFLIICKICPHQLLVGLRVYKALPSQAHQVRMRHTPWPSSPTWLLMLPGSAISCCAGTLDRLLLIPTENRRPQARRQGRRHRCMALYTMHARWPVPTAAAATAASGALEGWRRNAAAAAACAAEQSTLCSPHAATPCR